MPLSVLWLACLLVLLACPIFTVKPIPIPSNILLWLVAVALELLVQVELLLALLVAAVLVGIEQVLLLFLRVVQELPQQLAVEAQVAVPVIPTVTVLVLIH